MQFVSRKPTLVLSRDSVVRLLTLSGCSSQGWRHGPVVKRCDPVVAAHSTGGVVKSYYPTCTHRRSRLDVLYRRSQRLQ
jgi:hypothetical protein